MARDLDHTSTEYLRYDAAVRSTLPLTAAGWVYHDTGALGVAFSIGNSASANPFYIVDSTATYLVKAWHRNDNGDGATATATGNLTPNTWTHIAGVFVSNASRLVYRSGGNVGSDSTDISANATTVDRTALGAWYNSGSASNPWPGGLADWGVWNIALSAAEIAMLAAGLCPLLLRPEALVAYWPCGGAYPLNSGNVANSDFDLVGGYHLDPQNTPSVMDHPTGMIYPATRTRRSVIEAGGANLCGNRLVAGNLLNGRLVQ